MFSTDLNAAGVDERILRTIEDLARHVFGDRAWVQSYFEFDFESQVDETVVEVHYGYAPGNWDVSEVFQKDLEFTRLFVEEVPPEARDFVLLGAPE